MSSIYLRLDLATIMNRLFYPTLTESVGPLGLGNTNYVRLLMVACRVVCALIV